MSGQRSESVPNPSKRRRPRVGLVLGGGGILGAAWLTGALHALAERSGWDPQSATHIVGTSAGSVIGSLVGSGIPTWFLVHHQSGGDVSGMTDREGAPVDDADESSRRLFAWSGQVPRPVLGSPGLALRTALRPWRFPATAALSAWLGRGFLSTEQIGRMIRAVVGDGWSDHPNLWVVAVDYATGRRAVFGREDSPRVELWRAVEASCAIPGLYRPVRIDGRPYIDGGAWSPSNADLLARTDVEIVIVMNPMSSLDPGLPSGLVERFERRFRRATGRRLGREAARLRDAGKDVLLIQPRDLDLDIMGVNLMDPTRRNDVLEMALRTVSLRLDDDDARWILKRLS